MIRPNTPETLSLPFVNSKMDMSVNMFSLDFYQKIDYPKFVEEFVDCYNQIETEHIFSINASTTLYVTAFYFTGCTNCGFKILTNIKEGRGINCRHCNTMFISKAITSPSLDKILSKIETALGKKKISFVGKITFVLVQPGDSAQLKDVKTAFIEAGYKNYSSFPFFIYNVMKIGIEKNLFVPGQAFLVFSKKCESAILQYDQDTPLELEELIIQLRIEFGGLKSISVTMTEDDIRDNPMQMGTMDERANYLKEIDRRNGLDYTQLLTLIDSLIIADRLEEGKKYLDKAFSLMPSDDQLTIFYGKIELYGKNYQKALNYFLNYYRKNPIDRYNLAMIVTIYRQLNDENNYKRFFNELHMLGGPI